jgi:hypothetical protein
MVQNVTPKNGYRLVYRVEKSSSEPHHTSGDFNAFGNKSIGKKSWMNLPNPFKDGIKEFNNKFVCGANSVEQLSLWWVISKVSKPNKVRVLAVPEGDVLEGKKQVVFKRNKAKVIGKVNPDKSITIYKYGKNFVNEY